MKIAIFGIIPFTDLIKEGFIKLGHEISNNNPDLIFANDPMGYQDATFLKSPLNNLEGYGRNVMQYIMSVLL